LSVSACGGQFLFRENTYCGDNAGAVTAQNDGLGSSEKTSPSMLLPTNRIAISLGSLLRRIRLEAF